MKCVFFRLTTSRFYLYHSSLDCASVLCVSMVCSDVLEAVYKVVSSACMFMEPHLTACGRSFTNSTIISGPRMELVEPHIWVFAKVMWLVLHVPFSVFHLRYVIPEPLFCSSCNTKFELHFLQHKLVVNCAKCFTKVKK